MISHAQPNVLFFIIDDLNQWIGQFNANYNVRTPNIDRLAASGVLFKKAYCSAPYCNASRMSLFSGMRPTTTGIYHNESLPQALHGRLMPESFRSKGYYAFSTGKVLHGVFDYSEEVKTGSGKARWDRIFDRDEYWDEVHHYEFESLPEGRPFNSLFGNVPRSEFPPLYHHFDWGEHDEAAMFDTNTAESAIEFLKRDHNRPFFCAVGLYKPHLPWFAPKRFFDMYPIEEIILPFVKDDDLDDVPLIGQQFAKAQFEHERIVGTGHWELAVRAYLACVSYCDYQVGRVLDALDNSFHKENTVVVLVSDNGFHLGQKLHWSKFCLWEEASRVPLILRAPGRLPQGAVYEAPVSLLDVWPTLAELCRFGTMDGLEGESLLRLLDNPKAQRRTPVVTTWQRGNHSVREGHFRYTQYKDGGEELYHHITDPFEWHNVATDLRYREEKLSLSSRLNSLKATSAPLDWNPDRYLTLNPDVKSAGVDALEHFLNYGQHELRLWR